MSGDPSSTAPDALGALPAHDDDPLVIAGTVVGPRLVLGTGGAPSLDRLEDALVASGTRLTTVALRRVRAGGEQSVWGLLTRLGIRALPNTAGCFTARERHG